MRATVTSGAGQAANLARQPGLRAGRTTAPGSAGKGLGSAWFVGYQGGVAFAVIEFTRSPDYPARRAGRDIPDNLPG